MKRKAPEPTVLSPCQIVAWNFERARRGKGWSQAEMAKQLEPYVGYRMSRAAISKAERSLYDGPIRRFDADEIFALARIFNLAVGDFFMPPEAYFRGRAVLVNNKPGDPRARVTSKALTHGKATDLIVRVVSPEPSSEGERMRQQELTKSIIEAVKASTTGRLERAVASGVQSFLEDHPGALADLLKDGLPAEVLDRAEVNLTPAEQAKLDDKIISLVREKSVRTTKSRKEK